ncbi:hypothetical protein ABT336_15310 [Micromonospora sp. NPDC000207]|uniref:hypothetical protein n=1 Tax=Micromonospora sp. NPDC000207 TaxID=3154246 RepID=UPI00331A77DB
MARSARVCLSTVLIIGLLAGCGAEPTPAPDPVPSVEETPADPDQTPTITTPPATFTETTAPPSTTTPPAEPTPDRLDEDDLEAALIDTDALGDRWRRVDAGSPDSGAWPCDRRPDSTPHATAVRSLYHQGTPPLQATVVLYAFADPDEATGYLAELRENLRSCGDVPVEFPDGDGTAVSFTEIELVRPAEAAADAEVLSVAVRQTRHGQPVAEGVGVTFRLGDVVGAANVVAPARRDQLMDQLAVEVTRRQMDRAAARLGRGT